MPVFIGNKTENIQVQLFISEHTLNSALDMLHTRNLMKATQTVQSAIIKTFFPNFEEVFGRHNNLEIVF